MKRLTRNEGRELSDIPTLVDFIVSEAFEAEGRTPDRATIARGITAAFDDTRLTLYR